MEQAPRFRYAAMFIATLLALASFPGAVGNAQTFIVDQQNDPQPINEVDNTSVLTPGQTFIPGLNGIGFADFMFENLTDTPGDLFVRVRAGKGGTILGSSSISV